MILLMNLLKYLTMNSPDVINIGSLSNIRAWPEHEGLCKLARLLVDGGQAFAAINESEHQEHMYYFIKDICDEGKSLS